MPVSLLRLERLCGRILLQAKEEVNHLDQKIFSTSYPQVIHKLSTMGTINIFMFHGELVQIHKNIRLFKS